MATPQALDPTNRTVEIKLTNGKKHTLYFDLNTFYQFEEMAGKTLPSFLVELERSFAPLLVPASKDSVRKTAKTVTITSDTRDITTALSKLSVKDMRALIWSALHEYDGDGEPKWPYTIGKLGGLIDHTNLSAIMVSLMAGISGSMPRADKKDTEAKETTRPTPNPETPLNGGSASGDSDEGILNSLEQK